jgi:phosphoribosyl 1,2-cyclic phosphate phosphodiesterase
MGLDAADEMRQRMLDIGAADSKTIFCLNHFSHNCLTNYDDMQEAVGDRYLISYDGMSVEF